MVFLIAITFVPVASYAQTTTPAQTTAVNVAADQATGPATLTALPARQRLPRIALSVGGGPMESQGSSVGMIVVSGQVGLGRHLALEGEVAHWSARDTYGEVAPDVWRDLDRRDVTIVGANLYFHAGTPRISGVTGGGIGVHQIEDQAIERSLTGLPVRGPLVAFADTRLGAQLIGGVDVRLSSRLLAFGALRAQLLPDANVGATFGVRVAVSLAGEPTQGPQTTQARPPDAGVSVGTEVRVTRLSGVRQVGRFVSLSSTELVMRQDGGEVIVPLADVRRIERVSHHARNGALLGLAGGVGLALVGCAADDNFCGDDAGFAGYAALFGSIGMGAGLGIGAMVNASSSERHVIYQRPAASPSASLTPIAGARRVGALLRVRW